MVDFSRPDEVKHWLDGIEPAERRREVAITLAARAALRVLPFVGHALRSPEPKRVSIPRARVLREVVLPSFGATALAWIAGQQPIGASELLANYARVAARRAEDAIGAILSAPKSASGAATAAAFAADTVHVFEKSGHAAQTFDSALEAVNAHWPNLAQTALAAIEMTAGLEADATAVSSGRSAIELARTPLWPNGAPRWATEAWRTLKSALLATNQNWEVWTDWYEARLAGDAAHPPNEALEVARATIPDEIWTQGPAAVNAEIKRLIALHPPKSAVSVSIAGVELRTSVGDVVPSISVPVQGVEARASAGEVIANPASPPAGRMNTGDDPAVQLAARTRLQARAASEAAFVTQPPFPQSQAPSAGTAPQFIGRTTPPANLPPIETIPSQERAATQFHADAEGRIDVVRVPPTSDDRQRLLYEEMRHKAKELAALGQMLGDLSPAVDRVLEALPERTENASVDKLWSRANTLRRRHDAHVRAIDNDLGPNPARLDDLVAATLGDFVDCFNVYVLGDPRALELDSARLGPQDREAVRKIAALAAPIARAACEPQAPTTPAAQEALIEQVDAAIDAPNDINGDQAADLARKTTGNFVSELLRRAYAPIAKLGAVAKAEAIFAQKEYRSGLYRASGTATFAGLSVAALAYWPEISAFVVRNADALKDFVTALFHNSRLVEIIDLIVQAAKHSG